MHSRPKGRQRRFGTKAHVGVDSPNKLIHRVTATPTHIDNSQVLTDLMRGDGMRVWGGFAAYAGPEGRALGGGSVVTEFHLGAGA